MSTEDATEERETEVVDGRTYVSCVECGGFYELRGMRLHEQACNGDCESGRSTPPAPEAKKRDRADGEQVLSITDDPVLVCPGCGSDSVVSSARAADAYRAELGAVPAALEKHALYCNSCNRAFHEAEA
jgi:uncharacterized protein YbaR (Trm112 family)